jgi:quercetin dioxygenase-like cupin family protein
MELINKPEVTPLKFGNSFKTLQINGLAGTQMPEHHSTKEAVIVVQEGQALLKMGDSNHKLRKGSVFIIPAANNHSLKIIEDFKAVAIMANNSEINFI